MEMNSKLIAIALVSLLAAISPGPDFYIVLKNNLSYSRKTGLWTALGISLALIIHLSYTLVGIGILIQEGSFFYRVIKYIGIGYLFYLGLSGLISSFKNSSSSGTPCVKSSNQITALKALTQGFLTNLLNPKAALFFVSLFSQFIDPNTPLIVRIEYAFINWAVTLCWFLILSYLITAKILIAKIDGFRIYIDRVMGAVLMLFATRLLFVL